MEDSGRRGRDKYERERESSDRRRGIEWREHERPWKRLDDDDDDGRRNVRRRDRSNHGTGSESSAEDGGYSSDSDGRRRSKRRNSGRNERGSDREKVGSGRRGQEQEQNRKRLDAKDRNERQETDSDGKRSYSSDSDDRRRNNRLASERNERESDREKKGSEGRWQEDEQNRERLDVRDRNERQESGSDGNGSYSSDSDNRRRTNRRASERDARESDRERIGSERRGQQHGKRLDARFGNGRRSESSSDDRSYSSDSDSRRRSNRSTRERNQRERGRERQEQGQEKHKKNLQEAEDSNRKTREDVRDKNGRQHDSESSGDERDKRNELQQSRKRMDEEKDSQQGFRKGRDDMKEGFQENDLENSSEESDEKRSERQEQEQPRKRLEEDGDDMHKNKKDKKKNGRLENDSESSDEEQEKKRSGRKKMEQSRKRLDEDEKDMKEPVIEGRHGRRDERSRKNVRRGSDSESSGGESRRRDKDRSRRERERRRRRYDSDDSLDSDGRRRRHSTRRKNEHRDDKVMKQRRDLEDVDVRSMRKRGEKASEMKQVARDGKREEATKPQIQSTEANANPGGDLATLGRTGGVYIPPFKLARMMKEIEDKSSVEYQRLTWDALRKSINGLVNKVNATNIKNIIPELFSENLIRGRGLFCRSCMKSQMASPGFTDVFAALVAVVNTKFPEVGDLLLRRIVLQLKRAYKRNDKPQLIAAVKFIAHLVNQQVAHELVALELLTILLEQPTDDSVEVAVDFVKECGSILQDLCPKGLHGIFERFRGILHEGEIDKRVQFLIEGLFAIRKAKFQGHPAVRPELDLVEPEEQLTHEISLEDEIDPDIGLDIFKQDPNFADNEKRYEELKKSILGDDSEDEDASDAESDDDDDDDEEDEDDEEEQMQIKDETETNLVNLRRTIYLTIMSSVDFEEAGHKLLKIKLEPGQEMELCIMLLECCSQERTYLRYYGLLGQRFCMLNKVHQENFEKCFVQQYSMIHRLETNKLRNVAKFFAHLLGTDALPWHVLAYIRLTEEDTTSSSRIFIKILFQELSEHLGIRLLNERLNDPAMGDSFESIFPKDNPRNTRFSINFFTSIGLGGITENLREYLKNMPRMIMQQQKPESEDESGSGSGSDSSSSESGSSSEDSENSSSSDESSDSDDDRRRKRKNDGGSGRDRGRDRKRRKKT